MIELHSNESNTQVLHYGPRYSTYLTPWPIPHHRQGFFGFVVLLLGVTDTFRTNPFTLGIVVLCYVTPITVQLQLIVNYSVSRIMFGEGLLAIGTGEQHRKQRKILSPVFNVVHLRRLAPVLHGVAHRLRAALSCQVTKGPAKIDMLHWLTRCSIELFGQGGLGYSFDSFTDDAVHPYSAAIREVQPLLLRLSLAITFILPWGIARFQRAVVDRVPWKALHEFQDVLDVLDSTTRNIYQEKTAALGDANREEHGKDIMSILMQENVLAEDATEAEVLGQVRIPTLLAFAHFLSLCADDFFLFRTLIFAAAETTSTALAHILYLLAQNADAQDCLRIELAEAQRQNGGTDISYDALAQLPFLDAVYRETLRLYPSVPIFLRTSLADAVLPLSTPLRGRDGTELDALPIPRGTTLMLSLHTANRARSIWWPDATMWNPARWLAASLPESVTKSPATGVYQHLGNQWMEIILTFSGGPRACIGFKFAQLEIKSSRAGARPMLNLESKQFFPLSLSPPGNSNRHHYSDGNRKYKTDNPNIYS
ncbi:cytochrome P450 [Mycena polygramma]|nr:cytochrome P450 [Mycena polygramma]